MARFSDEKNQLIQILMETPMVNLACKKVGIGRATYYRWIKDNPRFKKEVNRALEYGRSYWNEIAESGLLKNIKNGDMSAIKYFLSNNDKRYTPKRSIYVPALDIKDVERYEFAKRAQPIDKDHMTKIMKAFKNLGLIKADERDYNPYRKNKRNKKR